MAIDSAKCLWGGFVRQPDSRHRAKDFPTLLQAGQFAAPREGADADAVSAGLDGATATPARGRHARGRGSSCGSRAGRASALARGLACSSACRRRTVIPVMAVTRVAGAADRPRSAVRCVSIWDARAGRFRRGSARAGEQQLTAARRHARAEERSGEARYRTALRADEPCVDASASQIAAPALKRRADV
jgi:hypothetical protein